MRASRLLLLVRRGALGAALLLAAPRALAQPAAPPAARQVKPPRLTRFVEADRPASERGRAATVVLRVTIDVTGKVQEATVVESAGPELDAAAADAVRRFVFEPAEIDGKPSPIRILYRYAFTLRTEVPKTALFDGVVRDRASGAPLADVTVAVDGAGTARTDAEGRFHLGDIPPGSRVVTLSGDKLTALRTEERFEAGQKVDATYDVQSGEAPGPASDGPADDLEIVVNAPALEKSVVATTVSAEEGRRLPGTQGDILKVVEGLPGVARAQVGSGALVVWGAAPEDTRVYVDGVRLPRLYHGGGLRSVVATDLVESVELAPGGYGAAYGRGLGGLVTVRTRRADEKELHAAIAVDTLDASASVRAPLTDKLRVAVTARRSHLHSVVEPFTDQAAEDFFPIPRYHDGQARIAYELSPTERIDLTGMLSSDRVSRTVASVDPLLAKRDTRDTSFERVYARWEKDVSGGSISVVPWFGTDASGLTNDFGGVPTSVQTDTTLYGFRASWRGKVASVLVASLGLDGEVSDARVSRSGSITNPAREGDARVFGQLPPDRVNADAWKVVTAGLAPFGELDLALAEGRVHVVPGIRIDPNFVSVSRRTPIEGDTPAAGAFHQDLAIEPRLALRWAASTRLDLRAAYGRYHQPAAAEDRSAVFGNPTLPASAADHLLFGSAVRLLPRTSLEATVFHVWQSGLATRNPQAEPLLAEALSPAGSGRSYGAQFLLRQSLAAHFLGWVSYAIVRSERRDGGGEGWRLSDYDQSHVLTAVGSYDLGRGWEVGARVRFATGFPRTPVERAVYDARRDAYTPVFGPTNTDRIPAFFQVDLRGSKRWTLPRGELEAYLELQNVMNRENPEEIVYSASYRDRGYITGLPILPVVGARWSL
ncbi:MAG: TonB family protein / TonB-dependent receptor [Labilithrix sp.]|nr:TonB family protein / TonB-dependent receptor [Labilithrix sp.]